MTAITHRNGTGVTAAAAESALVQGDLSCLTEEARIEYYRSVCNSLGLNPLTKPFAYIKLNGQLRLYALRDAADQLRKINGISIQVVSRSTEDGLLTVHVRAVDKAGRTDEDFGVVSVAGLKGEAAANAMLKCITKAKRRVTLSISGLGMLDETEVDDIPAAAKGARFVQPTAPAIAPPARPAPPAEDPSTGEVGPRAIPVPTNADGGRQWTQWAATYVAAHEASASVDESAAWERANAATLAELVAIPKAANLVGRINAAVAKAREALAQHPDDGDVLGPDDMVDPAELLRAG